MKKVAGSLRLDLAQFRELEAFAQLGTELDKATQAQLDRGKRMVEILKQPQYKPMAVEEQVLILFVGTQGILDDIAADKVRDFEEKFLKYAREVHPELGASIVKEKQITPDTDQKIRTVAADFKKAYKEGRTPDPRATR